MAVGLGIGLGIATGAMSALGGFSADKARARAIEAQNRAIRAAANATRKAQKYQNEFQYGIARDNLGSQNKALIGSMAATNSARGITGSRVADALKTNANEQAFLQYEDLSVSKMMADAEADMQWANTINSQGTYRGQSTGLMLLGAGLEGLNAGLSTYSAFK